MSASSVIRTSGFLLGLAAVACAKPAPPPPKYASLEGDVYLVMQSGDTKKAAANVVYLLGNVDSLQTVVDATCNAYTQQRDALVSKRADADRRSKIAFDAEVEDFRRGRSELADEKQQRAADSEAATAKNAITELESVTQAKVYLDLLHATRDTSATGVNAHYAFPRVPAGKYVLYAEWKLGPSAYRWWRPVSIIGDAPVRADLDNSSQVGAKIACGIDQ